MPIFRSSQHVKPNVYYGKPRNEHVGNQIYFHRQAIKYYIKQQQTLNEELVAYMTEKVESNFKHMFQVLVRFF